MRLTKLSEYRRTFFTPGSAPSMPTLRRRIERKEIPGGVILGNRYYVDLDELDRASNLRARLRNQRDELANSPELTGLI